jgi:1-acyl-sn-glycerol-3-phosphate acyltransferase
MNDTKPDSTPNESLIRRWLRRFCTVGFVFTACFGMTVCMPLLLPIAVICGFVRQDLRAAGRVILLVEIILVCETIGVVCSYLLWVKHMVRFGGDSDQFLRENFVLQCWWGNTLARLGMRLFNVRTNVENPFQPTGRPIILLVRHVSFVDTLIPVLLVSGPFGARLRYVLKRELLWDPCLDIVGNRLPNYFVRRDAESHDEIEGIARLADALEPDEGVLIYPEGTRFSEARRRRLLEKYADGRDDEAYRQVLEFKNVLPPKLGGVLALLERNSRADIVFCAHAGLECTLKIRNLLNGAVIGKTVNIAFWTVPYEMVPSSREDKITWLANEWRNVDAFVDKYQGTSSCAT